MRLFELGAAAALSHRKMANKAHLLLALLMLNRANAQHADMHAPFSRLRCLELCTQRRIQTHLCNLT